MGLEGHADRDPSVANTRGIIMAVLVAISFAVVIGRLYMLQVRDGERYRSMSQNNFVQRKRLEHPRGEIVDRHGRVLVTNRPSVNVYVTPAFFPSAKRMVTTLGTAAGLQRSESLAVSQALSKVVADQGGTWPPLLLAADVTPDGVRAVREAQTSMEIALEAIPIVEQAPLPGETEPRMAVYIDPNHFPSTSLVLRRLQSVLGWSTRAMKRLRYRVDRARGLDRYLDINVRRDLPPEIEGRLALEVQLGDLPGVTVRRATARQYVYEKMAAHLLGYINEVRPRELAERRDEYRLGDSIGRAGIERTFEEELRGKDGRETVVVDSKGRMQRSVLASSLREDVGVRVPPVPGNRVMLTIDRDLQQAAEAAFNGRAGAVVVMEVNTGRLLTLTSTPSYNPNLVAGYFDQREKDRLKAIKPRRPWRFRAIQDYFAPGSTFKVVTALAALKKGVVKRTDKVRCTGAFVLGNTRFRCWKDKGHGQVDLALSLARSCDVYYYTLATRLGLDPIADMGREMGFGAPTGIDLESESRGIMPDAKWYKKRFGYYTLGSAVNASIGQGAVSVTPLQLAVSFAAIANGGKVYKPQVVLRVERFDAAAREIEPEIVHTVNASAEHFALIRDGLKKVVNAPYGTAYRKRLKDVEVAGKTGTAQVAKLGEDRKKSRTVPWKLRDHAWFAAYAPADDPQIVIVVLNEHGGGGSSSAAPIAMKVAQAWHDLNQRVAGRRPIDEINVWVIVGAGSARSPLGRVRRCRGGPLPTGSLTLVGIVGQCCLQSTAIFRLLSRLVDLGIERLDDRRRMGLAVVGSLAGEQALGLGRDLEDALDEGEGLMGELALGQRGLPEVSPAMGPTCHGDHAEHVQGVVDAGGVRQQMAPKAVEHLGHGLAVVSPSRDEDDVPDVRDENKQVPGGAATRDAHRGARRIGGDTVRLPQALGVHGGDDWRRKSVGDLNPVALCGPSDRKAPKLVHPLLTVQGRQEAVLAHDDVGHHAGVRHDPGQQPVRHRRRRHRVREPAAGLRHPDVLLAQDADALESGTLKCETFRDLHVDQHPPDAAASLDLRWDDPFLDHGQAFERQLPAALSLLLVGRFRRRDGLVVAGGPLGLGERLLERVGVGSPLEKLLEGKLQIAVRDALRLIRCALSVDEGHQPLQVIALQLGELCELTNLARGCVELAGQPLNFCVCRLEGFAQSSAPYAERAAHEMTRYRLNAGLVADNIRRRQP